LRIESLVWLEDIVDKLLWKHDVDEVEVRDVLECRPLFRFVENGHRQGENVYAAFGRTRTGRYLVVFFVYKKDKSALILSARDMSHAERGLYDRS
jgi:uncharacterized DUF497 family protein